MIDIVTVENTVPVCLQLDQIVIAENLMIVVGTSFENHYCFFKGMGEVCIDAK